MIYVGSILLALLITFNITGCSSSDETNDSADNNFTLIEGTVPGTLIEAFCLDGSYYRVTSQQNDTQEHPFSLKIPKHLNCYLVMSTNELNSSAKIVTPISIQTKTDQGSLFYGTSNSAQLGFIPLALDRSEINDSTNDGVLDTPLNVNVYSGILVVVNSSNSSMDSDHDGIINIYEDDDHDGIYNREDNDSKDQNDIDGDGIDNDIDVDDDNDGIKDDDDDDDNKDSSSWSSTHDSSSSSSKDSDDSSSSSQHSSDNNHNSSDDDDDDNDDDDDDDDNDDDDDSKSSSSQG